MYCGWNSNSGTATHRVPESGGEFRQGVTFWRTAVLATILTPIAVIQLNLAGPITAGQWAIAMGCLILGPYVFALQLWRRYQGGIEVEKFALRFESGEQLAYDQIEAITLYTGLPTDTSERFGAFAIGRSGLARFARILMCGKIGLCVLIGPLMVLSYFLVPAVGLMTPFHTRIALTKTDGSRLVLHDLDEYWALYLAINSKMQSKSNGAPAELRRAA